jgi:NAD(P)-dependent dehydrogenase (short-subunit alcohol dehydrogenase family)
MKRYGDNNGMGIAGKVAVVTGAATGIGRGAAQVFAREGARVVVADLNVEGGNESVRLIKEAGGEATFIRCDVSNEGDVEALVSSIVSLYGSLDFAYNNAGVGPDGVRIPIAPITESPAEVWTRHLDVNLTGVFFCLKYEMRQMVKQEKGAVVICASMQAFQSLPGFSGYGATKTGLLGLTRVAALEGAPHNIRVNCICPGVTERTTLTDNLTGSVEGMKERIISGIPLGRLAFITGVIVPVDGGMGLGPTR